MKSNEIEKVACIVNARKVNFRVGEARTYPIRDD